MFRATWISRQRFVGVAGNTAMFGQLNIQGNILSGGNIVCEGEVASRSGGHILSAKKNFDIPHPTKKGFRLRHTCPEGPSNDVYFRGKLLNSNEIVLPSYWKGFVDTDSITVNITPIGAHQNIIVKRIGGNKDISNQAEEYQFIVIIIFLQKELMGKN